MSRKRKDKGSGGRKKKGGVMMGMRGGFQKVGKKVMGGGGPAGLSAGDRLTKKSSTMSNVIWLLILFGLLAFMVYRRS